MFLLGILFRHQAFRSPLLTSPHQLDSLDIEPGELEMRLPLKKEMDDVYVFRRAIETVAGYEISPSERITYAMMAAWIKRIGQILGFEYSTIAYSLRYNAGNEFDENGLSRPLTKMSRANSPTQSMSAPRYETSSWATPTRIRSANITSDATSASISGGFSEAKSRSKHSSSRPAALATPSASADR